METSELTPRWPEVPADFCAALKAARQRRGLTLAEISQQTKIIESHFVALERGDLRHWPKGIFRRAFFTDYVRAIGLPVEPTVAVFMRLFPDPAAIAERPTPEPSIVANPARRPRTSGEMRLALAGGPAIPPGTARRAGLAAADVACVVAAAWVGSWMRDADLATAVAVAALAYYSIATIVAQPHPGPALARRVAGAAPSFRRLRVSRPALSMLGERWSRMVSAARSTDYAAKARQVRLRLREWTPSGLERLKRIDLQRLRDATPQVIDRLKHRRHERERAERPMARPRPDSPRHARRRQDGEPDQQSVRVRIRLKR